MENTVRLGWQELRQAIHTMAQIFEVVRLVDPVKMQSLEITSEGKLLRQEGNCYRIWDRKPAFSNSTSLHALNKGWAVSEKEKIGKEMYQIFSHAVEFLDAEQQLNRFVLEMVSKSTPEDEEKRNTILIIDDQPVNRMILSKILERDYQVMEAESGKKAFKILERRAEEISAVILDLIMPQMDGYTIMERMEEDIRYHNIPILVITSDSDKESENKSLKAGAWDFITKPVNKETLCLRLKNIIARSQYNSRKYEKYLAEHDQLTGQYNRNKFFEESRKLISCYPEETFAFLRIDLDRFRLYNSFFGEDAGDQLLIHLAEKIQEGITIFSHAVCGRIEADIFGVCCSYEKKGIQHIERQLIAELAEYNTTYYIEPSIGVYVIEEDTASVENMYNNALLAAEGCKHKFKSYTGYYSADIANQQLAEQEVMNEAQKALEEEQFTVYLQPKTNIHTEQAHGAEALVRWKHPEKGLISPGKFIPVFESNGFIGRLDYYMWESTCKLLRKWLDAGLEPMPVSVNVSRANMYNRYLPDELEKLTKKYRISPKLLELELTESAFIDNQDMMIAHVEKLQDKGFTILMDDFGSGYSSLNTLKDIPVDILKIDMKFLGTGEKNGKSERILESVVNMAEWLDLKVIVEGVETQEQRDFLDSIGCEYAQGYYYAKPMPWQEYEQMLCQIREG